MAFRSSEGRERSRLADWSAAMLVQKRKIKVNSFPSNLGMRLRRETVCVSIRTVRGEMESVLRLKVRAIGTGAGSWIGKERELGWDRGAHCHSFCLRYITKVVQVLNLEVYVGTQNRQL